MAATDASGTVVNTYSYEPFGSTSLTNPSIANPFQFTGRENEGLAGLYYYRARYYDPSIGRFLSEDPISGWYGQNTFYAYVRNSPTNYVDPFGLKIKIVLGDPAAYQEAITYLKTEPGMAKIINDLEASSTTYDITINNEKGESTYDADSHTINWQRHAALKCTGGGTQSPALSLGHELAHADNPSLQELLGKPDSGYDNQEEKRDILGPETAAARTLGECTRTDHKGTFFWVPNVTSK